MGAYKDLTGARIGRLTVIQNTHQKNKNGSFIWKCLCDCGNEVFLPTSSLTRKRNTNSCGCYNIDMSKQKNTKNNKKKSKEKNWKRKDRKKKKNRQN